MSSLLEVRSELQAEHGSSAEEPRVLKFQRQEGWPDRWYRVLDHVRYEPVSLSFRVYSATGHLLGRFDDLPAALAAFNSWGQATSVVCGSAVVIERGRRVAA